MKDRQTDRHRDVRHIHDEANSCFPQVCESAQKWVGAQMSKNLWKILKCTNMAKSAKETSFNSEKPHRPRRSRNCTPANNKARVTSNIFQQSVSGKMSYGEKLKICNLYIQFHISILQFYVWYKCVKNNPYLPLEIFQVPHSYCVYSIALGSARFLTEASTEEFPGR
jgi:hypothetical protein